MLENVVCCFNAHIKHNPLQAVNFRKIFESELFGLALKQVNLFPLCRVDLKCFCNVILRLADSDGGEVYAQAIGRDVQSLYVEELGTTLTRNEIFHILVLDMMEGAIEVDWRDFFPYLKWVPNNKVEANIRKLDFRRFAVMKTLIKEHKKQNEGKKVLLS